MNAAGPANVRARFVALNPPFRGRTFPMTGPSATIGRGPECEVILDSVSVSRQHARVEEQGGLFHVRDLGSRNGIRVGEAVVREADLKDGDLLTVGEVQLRFETAPAAESDAAPPSARPLTGKDILSLVQSQSAPAAASGPAPEEGAPETQPRIGLNLKMIALIVLVLLLSLGLGAIILRRTGAAAPVRRGELNPVLVKIGEKRWLRLATRLDIRIGENKGLTPCDESGLDVSDLIPLGDADIADVEKYDFGEILITGKGVGDTVATFTLNNGTVLTQQIIVRGRLEDPLEALRYGRYTAAQRDAMAREFLENGTREQKDRPYIALQEYRKADAVLSEVAEKGATYLLVRKRLGETQTAIDDRWAGLRREIATALQNNDPNTAMTLLKEAVTLIPDPNDPRHQKAQWSIQNLIRQQLLEEAAAR